MHNLALLILFLILCGVLPILRMDAFVMYILQLKEYRRDRLKDFLCTPEGKKAFFNKFMIGYGVVFIFYVLDYWFLSNKFFFEISWVLVGMLFLDSLYVLYRIKWRRILFPKVTKRSMILGTLTFGAQAIIFLCGYFFNHFFVGIFLLLMWAYPIITVANIIMLPLVRWQKRKLLRAAQTKMQRLKKVISIGITGSFGKSSVKTLLNQLLASKYNVLSTPENVNTELGISQIIMNNVNTNYDYFIAEMGAYKQGEIRLLGEIVGHKYGFLTGLGNQHLSLFGSKKNIRKAKLEIAESIKEHNGKLYVNADSFGQFPGDMVTYSIQNSKAKAYSEIKGIKDQKTQFKFSYQGEKYDLETNLLGKHEILNLTGVLACLINQDIQIENIKDKLLKLETPNKTLQVHLLKSGLTMIDDSYNLSVEALRAWIDFLEHFEGDKMLVLDDILELGKDAKKIHKEIWQQLAQKNIQKIFLVGKNYGDEVKNGLLENNFDPQKIYFGGDVVILKTFTNGVVLLEGREAGKVYGVE